MPFILTPPPPPFAIVSFFYSISRKMITLPAVRDIQAVRIDFWKYTFCSFCKQFTLTLDFLFIFPLP
jgi:hypothetical protein